MSTIETPVSSEALDLEADSRQAARGPAVWLTGLRGRLLGLTVAFILLAELLIFPPSAANFRVQWLNERIQAAQIAALALEAAPQRKVSEELSLDLLEQSQLVAVATGGDGMRELLLGPSMAIDGPIVTVDLRTEGFIEGLSRTMALGVSPKGRFLRIIDQPEMTDDVYIDVIVPEAPLKRDLMIYCRNILLLSLLISGFAGGLVYLALYRLVVRPMAR
ncbi:MAG: sensor histidine kinase, partial [Pseudomonadota bacterium]